MAQLFTLEPPRIKSVSLSVVLGDGPAEILQQLAYHIGVTPKDKKHFHDGYVWVWNTYSDWHYQSFATMSISTIKRHFAALVDWGLVIKGEFNDMPTDRTLWWTIDWGAYQVLDDFLTEIFDSYKDPLGKDRKEYIETLKRIGVVLQRGIADKLGVKKPVYTEGRTTRHLPKWTIERVILTLSTVSNWTPPSVQNDTLLPETTPETTPKTTFSDHSGQNGSKRKAKPAIPKEIRDSLFESFCTHMLDIPYIKGQTKVPKGIAIRASALSKIAYREFNPPGTSEDIAAFAQDWRANHPPDFSMPTSDGAFQLAFMQWRGKKTRTADNNSSMLIGQEVV
jgi:hypothetical protein